MMKKLFILIALMGILIPILSTSLPQRTLSIIKGTAKTVTFAYGAMGLSTAVHELGHFVFLKPFVNTTLNLFGTMFQPTLLTIGPVEIRGFDPTAGFNQYPRFYKQQSFHGFFGLLAGPIFGIIAIYGIKKTHDWLNKRYGLSVTGYEFILKICALNHLISLSPSYVSYSDGNKIKEILSSIPHASQMYTISANTACLAAITYTVVTTPPFKNMINYIKNYWQKNHPG